MEIKTKEEFLQRLKEENEKLISKVNAGEELTEREKLSYSCIVSVRKRINQVYGVNLWKK
jgi:hypothetical protein